MNNNCSNALNFRDLKNSAQFDLEYLNEYRTPYDQRAMSLYNSNAQEDPDFLP